MKYVLVMQNGEVMAGVEFSSLDEAEYACDKYEGEYVAKVYVDDDGEECLEAVE